VRARCPAYRTTGDVDLRTLDWHRGAEVTALTPALPCRFCRPNAPFAELVCLSKSSIAEEYYAERSGNRWISEYWFLRARCPACRTTGDVDLRKLDWHGAQRQQVGERVNVEM